MESKKIYPADALKLSKSVLPLLLITDIAMNQERGANPEVLCLCAAVSPLSSIAVLIHFLNTLDFMMLLQHLTSGFRQGKFSSEN